MSGFQTFRVGPQRFVVRHPAHVTPSYEFRSFEEARDFSRHLQRCFDSIIGGQK